MNGYITLKVGDVMCYGDEFFDSKKKIWRSISGISVGCQLQNPKAIGRRKIADNIIVGKWRLA